MVIKNYFNKALEMKFSLEAGLIDVPMVVKWADEILLASDYDENLINISLGANVSSKEMISLLNEVLVDGEEWASIRQTMARMYDAIQEKPTQARYFAQYLENFWIRHDCAVPDDMQFIAGIYDDFQLAEAGEFGTIEEATSELLEGLSQYK